MLSLIEILCQLITFLNAFWGGGIIKSVYHSCFPKALKTSNSSFQNLTSRPLMLFLLPCVVLGRPRDLRVSDATTSSLKLSWNSAPGKVQQYLVTYTPATGGETKEVTLRKDATTTVLRDLEPGTRYDLSVTALYGSGAGDALSGQGNTLDGKNQWHYFLKIMFL